jgi:hypothetical protein
MKFINKFIMTAIVSILISCMPLYETTSNPPGTPFCPSLEIRFTVPEKDSVTVTLYDNNGDSVYQLCSQIFEPGNYILKLDTAQVKEAGVYFIRYKIGRQVDVKKIILIIPADPEEYINPEVSFPSSYLHEPGFGDPYPVKEYPNPYKDRVTVRQFARFGEEIKEKFNTSNCTKSEAATLFNLLKDYITITDESYGMPSPDDPPRKVQNLSDRILIKKIDTGLYHLYYYIYGCGCTYYYQEVLIQNGKLKLKPLETWRANYPC